MGFGAANVVGPTFCLPTSFLSGEEEDAGGAAQAVFLSQAAAGLLASSPSLSFKLTLANYTSMRAHTHTSLLDQPGQFNAITRCFQQQVFGVKANQASLSPLDSEAAVM